MHKLIVVTSYFYPDIGGVANHTYNLYTRLAQSKDFQIVIIASGETGSSEYRNALRIERLPFWFKISNTPINPLWFFQIKKIVREQKPDVMLIHTPVPFMADIAALVCGSIPLIVKYHHGGSMVKGRGVIDFFIRFYENFLLKSIFKKAKLVISSSDFVGRNYLSEYGNKMVTISPGVDLDSFKPGNFNSRGRRILFVANLNKSERYKGLEYLLLSMPRIKKVIQKVKLLVVGDGNDVCYYQQLCQRLGIEQDVVFLGLVSGDKLIKQYQKCNVVVLPSVFESCPNVLLEAMACGLPVAGSNSGGIPDLITDGENGYLFSARDPNNIARVVVKILSDLPLAKSLGEAGYKKVKNQFCWEEKVSLTQKAIEEVLPRQ